ncbi:MAG: methionyl-tRNA formyltransferase [Bacteroidales bacterium]|nr:methionyl-tRNA formyltransferase [Bacteroidales bacterium]
MDIKTLRIIYMGTPGFAVAPMEKLLQAGCNITAVITAPDRPAGRGKKMRQSEVKAFALDHGLAILQPTNLKDPDFVRKLEAMEPDLQVVVAFRMLPEAVWRIPRLGTFNLHASLLPQYRGAAPINHAIINGETTTGVTTFLIDEQIDTGNILLQEETAIGPEESAGDLHDRLMQLGAGLVVQTVQKLATGSVRPKSQNHMTEPGNLLRTAPKIYKEDCRLQWNNEGLKVLNLIRGLSPYPTAYSYLTKNDGGKVLCKIFSAAFEEASHRETPGTIRSDGKKYLDIAVKDGFININSIQQEGKQRMNVRDFLAGINLSSYQPLFS